MQPTDNSKARTTILNKIKQSLAAQKLPMPFPEAEKPLAADVFVKPVAPADEVFAENFSSLGGKFVFCADEKELLENIALLSQQRGWKQLLCAPKKLYTSISAAGLNAISPADVHVEQADACITACEMLVARTGSVLITSMQEKGRTASIFYPVHIIVAYANQVVEDIDDSINLLKQRYGTRLPSMINLNTGPSRTADIEKTLVVGVHGPGEVFCFYINQPAPSGGL